MDPKSLLLAALMLATAYRLWRWSSEHQWEEDERSAPDGSLPEAHQTQASFNEAFLMGDFHLLSDEACLGELQRPGVVAVLEGSDTTELLHLLPADLPDAVVEALLANASRIDRSQVLALVQSEMPTAALSPIMWLADQEDLELLWDTTTDRTLKQRMVEIFGFPEEE